MLLKGKKAIVTGGSKGIGKSIVETFLKNGCVVYTLSRSQGDFDALKKIADENGTQVFWKAVDVSNEESFVAVLTEVIKEAEGIDILVNNAGITKDGLMMRMATADWDEVIKVNLNSAFWASRAVYRHMLSRKGGSIINMSSIVGVRGNGGQANYSASKAGLIGLTKSMAAEVGSRGVRVNAICPGFIGTEMTDKLSDEVKAEFASKIPMKRMGTPEEIANVTLFLASDLSTYVTGQALLVDGGMGM